MEWGSKNENYDGEYKKRVCKTKCRRVDNELLLRTKDMRKLRQIHEYMCVMRAFESTRERQTDSEREGVREIDRCGEDKKLKQQFYNVKEK